MEITELNIVMLMFQPSIVARGMEKKLVEMNNTVESIVGDVSKVDEYLDKTDVFILNLPNKIADDTKEIKTLVVLNEKIVKKEKAMIVVGERELWEDLAKIYPGICQYIWVYRPVETEQLEGAIEKSLEGKQKKVVSGNRILIVDDDPAYAKMVREWIKDFYRVDIVTAGMQAITFLLKLPPEEKVSLILLDYEMPVVDGPQVLQMLRQDQATADIPVIFLTGVGSRESVARVMELKPDGYILKSTTRDNLVNVIDKKLGSVLE